MRRVLVVGPSGAGTTAMAHRLGPAIGAPVVELDALYYGPGLCMRPSFPDEIVTATTPDAWVVDSQCPPLDSVMSELRDLLWRRADTVVRLDYARTVVVRRAVTRSLRRIRDREVLWVDHRDSLMAWLRPGHPVRRAVTAHSSRRRALDARLAEPSWSHLDVVHLRSPAQADAWLDSLR